MRATTRADVNNAVKRLLDINVLGAFHTVRATLPSIISRRGYVLIVSSFAAYAASPGLAPYHAAKAGVEHFANTLRLRLCASAETIARLQRIWEVFSLPTQARANE